MSSTTGIGKPGAPVAAAVWALAGLSVFLVGLVVWSEYQAGALSSDVAPVVLGLVYVVTLLAFIGSGAVIASRQPGNIIGWLLIVPGLSAALAELANNWLLGLDPAGVTATPAVWVAIWYANWAWVLLIFPVFHLLLVFPDGKLLSPRWRWVVALEIAMVAVMIGGASMTDRLALIGDDDAIIWSIDNPIGFIPDRIFGEVFGVVWTFGLLTLTVAGVIAFVRRFRRGSGLQRQQLKWPLYAIALFGIGYGATAVAGGTWTGSGWDALFALSLTAIPVSVAIAVLRYRLYELDRIVSRTVTYAVVAALLVVVYGLIVLGLGSFLGRDSPLAVAGATLGAAALFNPVRRGVRGWVDSRFNRSRYDAQQVIERFVVSLRAGADPEGLVDGWVGVVSETMQPSSVGAWVRAGSR